MREFNIDYNKTFKPVLIVYLAIFLVGVIMAVIFGVNLDINFSGGTKISYSYTGEIETAKIEETTKKAIDKSFTVTQSTSLAGDTQTFEIALVGKTISHETVGKFGRGSIVMLPAEEGTGVIAGGPVRAVMEAVGIKNIRTKSHGSQNSGNCVKAAIEGLKELKTAEQVAALRGKTVDQIVG